MKTAVVRAFGLFASVVVAGVASAQSGQAVEWKVSEGGNGHWYQINTESQGWNSSRQSALSRGADLICFESNSELQWFRSLGLPVDDYLVGGRQILNSASPSAGWVWLTGMPVQGFQTYFDDDPCGIFGGGENNQQNYLHIGWNLGAFGDINDGLVEPCLDNGARRSILEWSADCNNDGIVDYGQILRGELEDLNSNGVPDICETSISSVLPPSVPAQGGSAITIRGNGFPANPTVLIGGVPATNVVRESLTRITATSPAVLPGMASVSVNDFTLVDGIYIRPECGSDLDQNGVVDGGDMSILLLDWGQCYATVASQQADNSTPFMLREQTAPPVARSN